MPHLTDKQVKLAEAKAADFGKCKLYMLLPDDIDVNHPQPYCDAICTFADRDYVLLIKPDGTWTQLEKEWSQK